MAEYSEFTYSRFPTFEAIQNDVCGPSTQGLAMVTRFWGQLSDWRIGAMKLLCGMISGDPVQVQLYVIDFL